jgi:hypothetical protein
MCITMCALLIPAIVAQQQRCWMHAATPEQTTSLLCVLDAMKYLVLINIGAVSHITASRDIGAQIKMHHLVAFEAAADGDKRRQMSNGHLS